MEGEICRQSGRTVDLPSGVILRPEASRSMVLLGTHPIILTMTQRGLLPTRNPCV